MCRLVPCLSLARARKYLLKWRHYEKYTKWFKKIKKVLFQFLLKSSLESIGGKKMGKPDVFKITFTGNKRVYYPGEMVTGIVVTQSRKKLKFRSIRMEFLGEARLSKSNSKEWNRSETYFDEKVEICGKGMEHVISHFILCYGVENGSQNVTFFERIVDIYF